MSERLLLTRSATDNQRLANKLRDVGIETISMPLLQIQACEETQAQRQQLLDLDRYHAVVVVSPVAARLGIERLDTYWPQPPTGIEWLAVGATTAATLEAYGLPVQVPDNGQDSEALMRMAVWDRLFALSELRVMIWRGVGGREHIAEQIRGAGGQVEYLELYERVMPAALAEQLAWAAGQPVSGVVISSAQALEHWHAAAADQWEEQRRWRCWVPSERVADYARVLGCTDIVTCDGADDAAVVAAVAAHRLT